VRFLTLCASVGNKRGFSIVDARCNHEVYRLSVFPSIPYVIKITCLLLKVKYAKTEIKFYWVHFTNG